MGKILIVEDDELIAELERDYLEAVSYTHLWGFVLQIKIFSLI